MKLRIVLCSLFVLIALSFWQPPSTTTAAGVDRPGNLDTISNVLYIIPGNNFWSNIADQAGTGEPPVQQDILPTNQPVYYLRDFPAPEEQEPFTALFGSDWMLVSVEGQESLFRLIAAKMPRPADPLYPLRLGHHEYNLETLTPGTAWPETGFPGSVMIKWAEWWQTETNSTPVVLILLQF